MGEFCWERSQGYYGFFGGFSTVLSCGELLHVGYQCLVRSQNWNSHEFLGPRVSRGTSDLVMVEFDKRVKIISGIVRDVLT